VKGKTASKAVTTKRKTPGEGTFLKGARGHLLRGRKSVAHPKSAGEPRSLPKRKKKGKVDTRKKKGGKILNLDKPASFNPIAGRFSTGDRTSIKKESVVRKKGGGGDANFSKASTFLAYANALHYRAEIARRGCCEARSKEGERADAPV